VNLAGLRAGFEKNKKPLAIAGAAGVAGLALVKSRGAKKDETPAAGASIASTGGQTASATGAAYDSSASDVYNAMQPQLEAFGQQLAALQNLWNQGTPTPVPAPPPGSSTPAPATPGTPAAPKPTTSAKAHPTLTSATGAYTRVVGGTDNGKLIAVGGYTAPAGKAAVGSVVTQDGQKKRITGYTFNGLPNYTYIND